MWSANAAATSATTRSPGPTALSGPSCSTFCSGQGPIASTLIDAGGFWYADPDARSPDIQLHFVLGAGLEHGLAKLRNAGVTLNSAFIRPRSRGTVTLRDSDPRTPPVIDP